ncbi:hypothetical protein BX600DRAFT_516571 [Xylariales sp. PMI_506]|nr:hypothetical protein BX600DRAFT_516571 [Xylariales sp. PMI_506]
MPFLRRRGVMASETDMRRHTGLEIGVASGTGSLSAKLPAPRKSLAEDLLNPTLSNTQNRPSREGSRAEGPDGNGESSSIESNMPSMEASTIGRPSEDPFDRPESPPIQEETPKHRRFSMLRFRNASDSQLSVRMKQQQLVEKPPPMPQPPAIITTAPTIDVNAGQKKSRMKIPLKIRRSGEIPRTSQDGRLKAAMTKADRRKSMSGLPEEPSGQGELDIARIEMSEASRLRLQTSRSHTRLPAGVEEHGHGLTLPVNRLSESSRSEASSGDRNGIYTNAIAPPLPQSGSTGSSFFRLARRKPKQPEPLFPLSHLPQKSKTPGLHHTISNSSLEKPNALDASRPSTGQSKATTVASPSHALSAKGPISPATALFRPGSGHSGQSSPTRAHLALRGRSSTMSSLGRTSEDHQFSATTRTSSSTGRKSFGDLLGLSKLRQNPDGGRHGSLTPATPGSNTSKNNSLQLTREKDSVVLPPRREDDTPAKYLARLEEVLNRGVIASALSKGTDPFSAAVLRSYMRTFGFFEEPMDMAIRKLLMEAELPKETQQIDRCLQAFANRYHECNPGIYSNPDQAYFIAFSLLILHTDVFNKNNKYKMQKTDYLKNTRGEGIFDDVLECFYDNITYTPFIHVEDDFDINGDRIMGQQSKKKTMFPNGTPEQLKRSKDPIDPYTMILDGKLDTLRPPLKDQVPLDEHYNYLGTAKELNVKELQKTFFRTGVLQIVSARSRPDAFMSEKTVTNPQEADPGIVDIKITKVGTLWRKDPKKKKTRSPWQEWGAILTGAQLYFFRNTAWVKSLMHQYETHVKSGHDGIPLIFKPPLEHFKPDALMSTDRAVALWDKTYKKHKNAFVYVKHGGLEEILLAQSEEDRNDWLAKLNYAAAFRTSGVRMRGVVGGNYEGQNRRAIRRLDSSEVTQVVQTPTGEVSINRSRIDRQMAHDILAARRYMITDRINEANEKLQAAQKHLDTQLRNARHLLILAPIQEKTRDQVRGGAARIIAQLKWSRTEIWRLKCHRDILSLDLDEEKQANGEVEEVTDENTVLADKTPLSPIDSKTSSHQTQNQQSPKSPAPLTLVGSSGSFPQRGLESPETDVFQTPPTSATVPTFQNFPSPVATAPVDPALHARKTSISSIASSGPSIPISPPKQVSSPSSDQARAHLDGDGEDDAGERQVLEQAGLLDMELSRTSDRPPSSNGLVSDETVDRHKRTSASEKDRGDRSKLRRSLQRTLREGPGHLTHHRSRRARDSTSSGAISDDTIRDDVLSRGSGSFTVHGKKASVITFGSDLQNISPEERIRQRKHSQTEDQISNVSNTEEDFKTILEDQSLAKERRESAASASTATARSFRELHRKYSSAQNMHRAQVTGGLVVPSDDDSDAAISFSDGRRTPLPPLEDGSGDEAETSSARHGGVSSLSSKQPQFFTPEPPGSPVEEVDEEDDTDGEGADRLSSPPVQTITA